MAQVSNLFEFILYANDTKDQLTTLTHDRDAILEQIECISISLKMFSELFAENDKFYTKSHIDPYRHP